jgi:hypothetical protein
MIGRGWVGAEGSFQLREAQRPKIKPANASGLSGTNCGRAPAYIGSASE